MKKSILANFLYTGLIVLFASFTLNNPTVLNSFFFDGLSHNCVGLVTTNINTSGTQPVLEISNIGDTGNDGIDISLTQTKGFGYHAYLPDPNTLPEGAYVMWKYMDEISNTLLVEKQEVLTSNGTPRVAITYDASSLGASELHVAVYNNNNDMVYENIIANNEIAYAVSSQVLGNNLGFDTYATNGSEKNTTKSNDDDIVFIPPSDTEISLAAGGVIMVSPVGVAPSTIPVTKVELRAAQVGDYEVAVEQIAMFEDELFFHALGSTQLVGEQDGGFLNLNDMNGGGDDGIRVDLGEKTLIGFEKVMEFEDFNPINIVPTSGSPYIMYKSEGKLTMAGDVQDLGYIKMQCDSNTIHYGITADFTLVGDDNPIYQIYNDGVMVAEMQNVNSLIVEDWMSSSAFKTKQPGLTKYANILFFPDDQNMLVNGESYIGDEIRIVVEVGENIWLTALEMLVDGISSLDVANASLYIEEDTPCDSVTTNTFSSVIIPADVGHIDFATEGIINQNGEYVLLGFKDKGIANEFSSNLVFAKLDQQGNHLITPKELKFDFSSEVSFVVNNNLQSVQIVETLTAQGTADGYAAVATFTESGSQRRALVFKLDMAGNVLWAQELDSVSSPNRFARGLHYNPTINELTIVIQAGNAIELFVMNGLECTQVKEIRYQDYELTVSAMTPLENMNNPDAAFAITGRTGFTGQIPYYIIVDNNLNPITDFMTYDLDGNPDSREEPFDIKQDGNFLMITGSKENLDDKEIFLMKILPFNFSGFSVGSVAFAKNYDINDKFEPGLEEDTPISLVVNENSEIAIAGFSNHTNGRFNSFLLKTNQEGFPSWTKRYTDLSYDNSFSFNVELTPDGGFYLLGEQFTSNQGVRIWAAITDADGALGNCDCVQDDTTTVSDLMPTPLFEPSDISSFDCMPLEASFNHPELGMEQLFCDQYTPPTDTVQIDEFIKLAGDSLPNRPTRIKRVGNFLYVSGNIGTSPFNIFGTFSQYDLSGNLNWTVRLDSVSNLVDFVPVDDQGTAFLVVGRSEPVSTGGANWQDNESIVCRISSLGNIDWVQNFQQNGREYFTNIVRVKNSLPPTSPFYIIGAENNNTINVGSDERTLVININENGVFNWRQTYRTNSGDTELYKHAITLTNGNIALFGNHRNGTGAGYRGGVMILGSGGNITTNGNFGFSVDQFIEAAVEVNGSTDLYIGGEDRGTGQAFLARVSNTGTPIWSVRATNQSSFRAIQEAADGSLYVLGRSRTTNLMQVSKNYLSKITVDSVGNSNLVWTRLIDDGETAFNVGDFELLDEGLIAYVDGRQNNPVGAGDYDMLLSISSLDFNDSPCAIDTLENLTPYTLTTSTPSTTASFSTPPIVNSNQGTLLNYVCATPCGVSDPCIITCPEDITVSTDPGVCTATVNDIPAPTLDGDCSDWSLVGGPFVNVFPVGCNDITWIYENSITGLQDVCVSQICVEDNEPPVVTCADFSVDVGNGTATIAPFMIGSGSDNCPGALFEGINITTFDCDDRNTTTQVTYTVGDQAGNSTSCIANVFAKDFVAPMIVCPSDITLQSGEDPNDLSITGQATATDICDPNPLVSYTDQVLQVCPPAGLIERTWTATDDCGNTVSCIQEIFQECGPPKRFNCGEAIVTCFSSNGNNSNPNGFVLGLKDIRDHSGFTTALTNNPLTSQMEPSWTAGDMGEVFGIAIDKDYNIYLTATTIYKDNYFGAAGNTGGEVFIIDGVTGVSSLLVRLPNSGQGLGNVAYAENHDALYVTNFDNGNIYKIPLANPNSWTAYDPFGLDNTSLGYAPLGQLTWGIAYHTMENRIYFGRWNQNSGWSGANNFNVGIGANEIYSVGLDGNGDIDGSTQTTGNDIIVIPQSHIRGASTSNPIPMSNPISDISFSCEGRMLTTEKSMRTPNLAGAHNAKVREYVGSHIGGWSLSPKQFYIANAHGNHSSGGVDYGYESFDPAADPLPPACDSLVWATCDAYRLQNTNTLIYGIAGIPAFGNQPSPNLNSFYIDADGSLDGDKFEIGDVEIFDCGCPPKPVVECDSLMVMENYISSQGDSTCCLSFDFKNQIGNDITKICVDINSPDWIFNTGSLILNNNFTWETNTSTTICFEHPGGIPTGDLQNVLEFCLLESDPSAPIPQELIFSWYQGENQVVCMDTIYTDCDLPNIEQPCLTIDNFQVDCSQDSDLEYCVTFDVTNNSGFDAYSLILENLPAGYSFGDCGCGGSTYGVGGLDFAFDFPLGSPLQDGATQTLCVKIISAYPVFNPTNICLNGSLEGLIECCSSPTDFCFTFDSCCDPCSSITTNVQAVNDSCCYALSVDYDCEYDYFTKIDFDIITTGVYFGNHFIGDPNWNVCGVPSLSNVCIEPITPEIPSGNYTDLFNFCLTDIDASEIPQQIHVKYWTIDSNGQDSIACDTILTFDCPPSIEDFPCTFITDEQIECIPDSNKYRITVTVQNISNPNFTAEQLSFWPTGDYSPNPVILNPPLPNDGSTRTVSFCYTPTTFPDLDGESLIVYRLKDIEGDSCCNGNLMIFDTLMLPSCDTICCADQMAFETAVENAVTVQVNQDSCKATVSINNLPDCDAITQIEWGDGNSSFGPFNNGDMPMHMYGSVSGVFVITIHAAEFSQNGDTCFTHTFTETIDLNCPPSCECDGWETLSFGFLGQFPLEKLTECNNTVPVELNCPEKIDEFYFHGNFNCTDACGGDVDWEIIEDGSTTPISSGIVIGTNGGVGNSYHFDINGISYPTSAGSYKLKLQSTCGSDNCECEIAFIMPECTQDCICENPIIPAAPASIITAYHLSNCINVLSPSFLLDDECDEVTWSMKPPGQIAYTTIGTSLGNNPFSYDFGTFAGGDYIICMGVERTLADGTTCPAEERCQKVKIKCGQPTVSCVNPLINNSGFTEGTTPGILGNGGSTQGWEASFGAPEILDMEGCVDQYAVAISGNKVEADGLSTQVELTGAAEYALEMCMSVEGDLHENASISVRISENPQDGLNCTGPCEEVARLSACCIVDTIPIWITFPIDDDLNDGTKYLTFHVENESEEFKSTVVLDGICLEPFDYIYVSTNDIFFDPDIQIFPNPTDENINIKFSESLSDDLDYRIVDLLGRAIQYGKFGQGQITHQLQMNGYPEGIYIIEMGNHELGFYREKIVKHNP